MSIKQLDHLNLTVNNLQESVDWYGSVFGFQAVESGVWRGTPWTIIRSGEAMLCLYEKPDRSLPDRDSLDATKSHAIYHVGFRVTDEETWTGHIQEHALEARKVEYPHSTSWYLRDPTGYMIETVLWKRDQVYFEATLAA